MQEIGVWTTAEGTVGATLELESEITDDDTSQELPKWASGALSGAAGGAATGAAACHVPGHYEAGMHAIVTVAR